MCNWFCKEKLSFIGFQIKKFTGNILTKIQNHLKEFRNLRLKNKFKVENNNLLNKTYQLYTNRQY